MKVWVCIPVFNRVEFTLKCLESLYRQTYRDFAVVVCDHGSSDGTSEQVSQKFPEAIVLQESSDLWWTGAINCCIRYALDRASADDVIVTLNNDLEVAVDHLSSLVQASESHPDALIASAGYDIATRMLVAPGIRHSWYTSKSTLVYPEESKSSNDVSSLVSVTHAPGRGTLIPVAVFEKIGLFDEMHLPHYGADYDFSFRAAREGYEILLDFDAKVYSHVNETGLTRVHANTGVHAFYQYLFSIKSPANISARWWVAWKNCPRLLLPTYLLLDIMFVVGGYIKKRVING